MKWFLLIGYGVAVLLMIWGYWHRRTTNSLYDAGAISREQAVRGQGDGQRIYNWGCNIAVLVTLTLFWAWFWEWLR